MIRVFSGGRYTAQRWFSLGEILENGLTAVCINDCDNCNCNFACREVSQAITFCYNKANAELAKGRK